jgi:hypothetical protein
MPVFQLRPVSLPSGSFAAAWFDDAQCLWDVPDLRRASSLIADWKVPALRLHRPELGATAVLFNPNAFAVSNGVRDELACFPEREFLPIRIEGYGQFFVLHVGASYELPEGSHARTPDPPGNIVNIEAFLVSFEPSLSFFRIRQPAASAAGRAASCVRATYANAKGAQAMSAAAGAYLSATEVPRVPDPSIER